MLAHNCEVIEDIQTCPGCIEMRNLRDKIKVRKGLHGVCYCCETLDQVRDTISGT